MSVKTIAVNRKARYNYHIQETIEAGLALTGTEIKSIRDGRVSLGEAYGRIRDGEAWLVNAHIAAYPQGGRANHDPRRDRKLLLHKSEIRWLAEEALEKGMTLVPLRLYLKNGRAKLDLGVARGKKAHDKRQTIAAREASREAARSLRRSL